MFDIYKHNGCPLWQGLMTKHSSWKGLQYTCSKVVQAYCKVFAEAEAYKLFVRKTCQQCKCSRELDAIYQQQVASVRERLGVGASLPAESSLKARDLGYTWIPAGILTSSKIHRYFEQIPSDKVPRVGSAGARYREQQIVHQLPKQDLSLGYCKHVDRNGEASFEDFAVARNELALDIGYVRDAPCKGNCNHCKKEISAADLVISTAKFAESVMWHPGCFVCSICKEFLVDLMHCVYDNKVYCERDYAGRVRPRCADCDEKPNSRNESESPSSSTHNLIFSGEYTKAMDKDWHSSHFSCWQCDENLTGQRYVIRDDHPYCIQCYENVFANTCEECNKIIGIDSKDLSYKDKHWHEGCFLCYKCHVSLVDKQFGAKAEKIYCGNCYDSQFASRCDGCGEVFRAGTKKMEYKTRQWHENCFCCCVCKTAIGTKSFIPREQEIYCSGCYEEKFATRCIKCNKVITSGGVTYKNEPWHRECFTCTHCNIILAGQRFTSRDEKPYCAECYGELFAKRCTSCVKPITGIGGTRFISFEDRHWHHDCFICANCKTSLVGRGFITDGEDIICPECAKQKLM